MNKNFFILLLFSTFQCCEDEPLQRLERNVTKAGKLCLTNREEKNILDDKMEIAKVERDSLQRGKEQSDGNADKKIIKIIKKSKFSSAVMSTQGVYVILEFSIGWDNRRFEAKIEDLGNIYYSVDVYNERNFKFVIKFCRI